MNKKEFNKLKISTGSLYLIEVVDEDNGKKFTFISAVFCVSKEVDYMIVSTSKSTFTSPDYAGNDSFIYPNKYIIESENIVNVTALKHI